MIATVDDRLVEIQIRTFLQDRWAQAFEKLADVKGRGIRYGEMEDDPKVQAMLEASQQAGAIEKSLQNFRTTKVAVTTAERVLEAMRKKESDASAGRIQSFREATEKLSEVQALLAARLKEYDEKTADLTRTLQELSDQVF